MPKADPLKDAPGTSQGQSAQPNGPGSTTTELKDVASVVEWLGEDHPA
jgi:hypothetical protein